MIKLVLDIYFTIHGVNGMRFRITSSPRDIISAPSTCNYLYVHVSSQTTSAYKVIHETLWQSIPKTWALYTHLHAQKSSRGAYSVYSPILLRVKVMIEVSWLRMFTNSYSILEVVRVSSQNCFPSSRSYTCSCCHSIARWCIWTWMMHV